MASSLYGVAQKHDYNSQCLNWAGFACAWRCRFQASNVHLSSMYIVTRIQVVIKLIRCHKLSWQLESCAKTNSAAQHPWLDLATVWIPSKMIGRLSFHLVFA